MMCAYSSLPCSAEFNKGVSWFDPDVKVLVGAKCIGDSWTATVLSRNSPPSDLCRNLWCFFFCSRLLYILLLSCNPFLVVVRQTMKAQCLIHGHQPTIVHALGFEFLAGLDCVISLTNVTLLLEGCEGLIG